MATSRVLASRFVAPAGSEETVFALNSDDHRRDVRVEGLTPGRRYKRVDWNRGGQGKSEPQAPMIATGGGITVTIPPRGIVALSTRAVDV